MDVLKIWQNLHNKPGGKWAFSKALCLKAPYFSSIHPKVEILQPDLCQVSMKKTRQVQNHLGTVHAIAMCNMAELAGGTLTEVAVPATHRWIPKGMTVEYLQKATTDLTASATALAALDLSQPGPFPVEVNIHDQAGTLVFRAEIQMWVSPKKSGRGKG